jgi:nucleoid-associated protein YgaU
LVAIAAGVVTVAVAVGIALYQGREESFAPPQPPAGETAKPPSKATVPLPAFDVVRVDAEGHAVIAGRAEPASRVIILDTGAPLGEAKADAKGEWVHVPPAPLQPGTHELALRMVIDGKPDTASEKIVVVVVPDRPGKGLALALPKEGKGATALLQAPGKGDAAMPLAVDMIDYDDQGELSIAGRAPAGAIVQLYADELFLGRTQADDKGRWSLTPTVPIAPGVHGLRADQIDARGKVAARVAFPFSRAEPPPPEALTGGKIVVQPGNSLWRIARRAYGSGFQFTVIYEANQGNIRDPDLIYPGQVFYLPRSSP